MFCNDQPVQIPDLIGAKQVAELLHCDRATVLRHASRGTLPSIGRLPGPVGGFVFSEREILAARDAGWPCTSVVPLEFEAVSE